MAGQVTQITEYTPAEMQEFLRQGIKDAVKDLEFEQDEPASVMMERLHIGSHKTFRRLIQKKGIKPYRVIGNIPTYKPSAFIQ